MNLRTAGIIIIGDEILNGDVKDENTHFLCKRFHTLGVSVIKVSVVGDTLSSIAEEVKKFSEKYDVVITSGGIGPTHDDITYEGIACAFNEELVTNKELKLFWERFYVNSDTSNPDNPAIKMSKIPKSGRIINVKIMKQDREFIFPFVAISNVYVFPGIPMYLRAGFSALEKEHFTGGTSKFYNCMIYLNVHESHAIFALDKVAKEFADSVKIGSYPIVNNPYYLTKITLESTYEVRVEEAHKSLTSLLNQEWIEINADFLENALINLKNLIESEDIRFSQLISKSYQTIIKCFEDYNGNEIFLCFNGGKDCTVLLHLVHCYFNEYKKSLNKKKIQVLYIRSKDSFQETEDFITDTADRYDLDMTVVNGPIKKCLEILVSGKKSHWKAVLMGTRKTDPNSDKLELFQETDAGWPKLMRVSPFLDWSYQDVWHFLRSLNIPYCSLYDQGYTSLGSRHNTVPNPDLAYEEDGVKKYKPAYTLENPDSERNGRC